MTTGNCKTPERRYQLLGLAILFLIFLLGAVLTGSPAHAAGSQPSRPASAVLCVKSDGSPTGSPCANGTGYTTITGAIAAASPGDEIRISSGGVGYTGDYTYTVVVDKPLTLVGGFSGNPTEWGTPTCTDPDCTKFDGEHVRASLVVQGAITVTIENIGIFKGGIVNNSGTINVPQYGVRLHSQADTNAPTINGHFNITNTGYILLLDGTQLAQAGTSFTGNGYLLLSQDGDLDVSGNTTVYNLQQYYGDTRSGTISGGATLDITHDFIWSTGVMRGTGVTNIQPGATLEFHPINGGGGSILDTRTLNNLGIARSSDNGYGLTLKNGGTFNNAGTFNVIHNLELDNDNSTTGTFNNTGVLRLVSGSGNVQVLKHTDAVIFNNSGNIDIPGTADDLHFLQGTINMNAGSTVTGAGTAFVGGQTGNWNVAGTVTVQNLSLLGGNVASLTGSGTLTVLGHLEWSNYGSSMAGSGATNVATGATLTMGSSSLTLDGRTLNNAGTASFSSDASYLTMKNGAVINNTGTFTATLSRFELANDNTAATFNNVGTFYISNATSNFSDNSIVFNNSGLLDMRSGSLNFNGGSTFNQTSGTTRVVDSTLGGDGGNTMSFHGGRLLGNGFIGANVNNTGASVEPGNPISNTIGVLTIGGNYSQAVGGSLDIDLAGHTAGTEYDQLHVIGAANLAGNLDTADVNGFGPAVGDQFQVLLYGSHTGAFGAINGGDYTANYNQSELTLVVSSVSSCTTFSDVQPGSTFYPFVTCLVNHGVINGYSDCTFRPGNNVTRGQLSKIVALAAGYNDPPGAQLFEDVAPASPFYGYVQNLGSRNIIGGYACGGSNEPCGGGNLPYFRLGTNVTRGQISKITAIAAGLPAPPQGQWTFTDAPVSSTFWTWIESLATAGSINGYGCGGPGEPCDAQQRAYFRPSNSVTRGQSSKIVVNTFFPSCQSLRPVIKH